jgi:hypothetical protein
MSIALASRGIIELLKLPRNEKGHFLKTSELSEKNLGLRLRKEDYKKVVELAQERGVRPTELVREAVGEWLKLVNVTEYQNLLISDLQSKHQ